MASASPLLYSLLESTMKEVMATLFKLEMSSTEHLRLLTLCSVSIQVQSPLGSGTLYDMMGEGNWEARV